MDRPADRVGDHVSWNVRPVLPDLPLLPERKLTKTALLIGAVASTILFSLGRIGIGFYLGHTDAVKAFGAAGSLAVVLIWVYYSALAFFVGALVPVGGILFLGSRPAPGRPKPAAVDHLRVKTRGTFRVFTRPQYSTGTGSSDRHRYHVATLRYGRQRVPISRIVVG